jgi:mono/diheme cytochrome c family protein
MGRIWRITAKNDTKDNLPDLSKMGVPELAEQLNSPNGWTRDTAQRLLIEKEGLSAQSELLRILAGKNSLAKLHALWTLEGLGYYEPSVLLTAVGSKDPLVAQTALRLLLAAVEENPSISKGIERFIQEYYDKAESSLQMQMVLASNRIDKKIAFDVSRKFLSAYGQLPVTRDVIMSSLEGRESDMLVYLLSHENLGSYNQNHEIFFEILATAILNSQAEKDIEQLKSIVETLEDSTQGWIKNALASGMNNTTSGNSEIVFTTPTNIDQKVYANGRQNYINLCASCHGTQGEGMKRFAPPLKQSEWVTGDEKKLAMLLLHGMQGAVEVNGKKYDSPDILPEMPSFSTLQNEDIAAIATYIRNAWGNTGYEVTGRTVGGIRFRTQGKVTPWTAAELDTLVFDLEL